MQQNLDNSGFLPLTVATGDTVDSNGFLTDQGSLIHVGNAVPLVNGATNNQTANPSGCVTSSDNSNYCLLAPLPGVGDSTGNLNVKTGIGTYFLSIIKLVMGIIGVLSVVMIVVGGIEYMVTVKVSEKEGSKSRITSALLGLLLALSSYIILNTINSNLVNLGVNTALVVETIDAYPETTTGPGVSVNETQVTPPVAGSESDMAKQLLSNGKVTFSGGLASNAATNDLQKMSSGGSIIRTDGSTGPALNPSMLAGLLKMAQTMPGSK